MFIKLLNAPVMFEADGTSGGASAPEPLNGAMSGDVGSGAAAVSSPGFTESAGEKNGTNESGQSVTQKEAAAQVKKEARSQEDNAESARIRRESEQRLEQRRAAERAAEIQKIRNETIIETLGGVNPYTGEKITDDVDLKEYLAMREIAKSGKDPVADYTQYLKSRSREQDRAVQAQKEQEAWLNRDRNDFIAQHPDVKLEELLGDDMFRRFAAGKAGIIPMTQIYGDYKAFEKAGAERAAGKAAQILANASAPGKLSVTETDGAQFFTREQVKAMSAEEVKANYEKITASMEKWAVG